MGFFFKKRIKIFPGLYMNLSKSGVGFSAGVKGCRVSVNSKGDTYLNAGSNGFYIREKLNSNNTNIENIESMSNNDENINDAVKIYSARAKNYYEKIKAINDLNLQGVINDEECEKMKQQIEGGNPQEQNYKTNSDSKENIFLVLSLIGFIFLMIILGMFLS